MTKKWSKKDHEKGAFTRTLLFLVSQRPCTTRELAAEIGFTSSSTSTLLYQLLAQKRIQKVRSGVKGRAAISAVWYVA